VSTAFGRPLTLGKSPASPQTVHFTFWDDKQLGGFFGKEGSRVNSLGIVIIDTSCLVGVDTTVIKEPIIPLATPKTAANS